ncbi:alpha/beta fold hydrolase [Microtetraspora malaysiensis]|uniref:alpha/beta fold hydrolase n=1 Tax=Microtetraspora malaysiensis TaxID=161358 RepID=UPI003D94B548
MQLLAVDGFDGSGRVVGSVTHCPARDTARGDVAGCVDVGTFVAPEQADRLRRSIPGSTLRMFPGLGHVLHEDEPALVNPVLAGFLGLA